MKIQFLGTGNASGIPSPFCLCKVCHQARTKRDQNRRTRTSTLINHDLLIDLGPDFAQQCYEQGLTLEKLENILITHTHTDHFSVAEISHKYLAINREQNDQIKLYMTREAEKNVLASMNVLSLNSYAQNLKNNVFNINPFSFGDEIHINDYRVIPFKGIHQVKENEKASNYIIIHHQKTLLYGTDTALYDDDTLQWISHYKYDALILDCDNCFTSVHNSSHMSIYDVNQILEYLHKTSSIDYTTPVFLTHLSHKDLKTHQELNEKIKKDFIYHITLAFDGLVVNI